MISYLEMIETALVEILTDVATTGAMPIKQVVIRSFDGADDIRELIQEGFGTPLIVMTPQGTGIPVEIAPGRISPQKVDMRFTGSIAIVDASTADFERRRKPMYRLFHQFLRGLQDVRLNQEPFGVNVTMSNFTVTSSTVIDSKEFYATAFTYRYDLLLPTKAVM